MDFTLDQLLMIVGRLDDSPGFDTPRERFRRFLQERMTALEPARLFIQHSREQSGEQSHRVLQDVTVLFGRFLGFDTAFGRYQHDPGDTPAHGTWQARHRLHVTVMVCTDQTADVDPETVSSTVAAADADCARIGLLVLTPLYPGKARLEQALAAGKHPNLRLASLRGLLRLATLVEERHLAPDDVLQVFNPAVSLDARVDLLERVAAAARPESAFDLAPAVSLDLDARDRRYWVSAMRLEPFAPTERIVRSLIGTRQLLGIKPAPGVEDRVRIGDAICVFVTGRGIVAHATIGAILTDGSRIIRDAKRFTHVLRLIGVTVYETPVVPHQELARKLDLALAEDPEAVTVSIAPREFESITAHALSETG